MNQKCMDDFLLKFSQNLNELNAKYDAFEKAYHKCQEFFNTVSKPKHGKLTTEESLRETELNDTQQRCMKELKECIKTFIDYSINNIQNE